MYRNYAKGGHVQQGKPWNHRTVYALIYAIFVFFGVSIGANGVLWAEILPALQMGEAMFGTLTLISPFISVFIFLFAGQFVERVGGVRVSGLVPGMPAEKQLVVGDVVRSVEGIPLTNSLDLTRAVQSLPPGLEVKLSVRRVKRDAAGKALVDGEGLELTEDLNIGLRLGSTDDLLEKGDALGGVANAVWMERQGAAANAAQRFLPKLRVVEFPQRAAVTDAVVAPTTIDSVRAMLMELQLAGGDAELVRIHRQRLDFLAQQMALVKDEHTRRGFQATLEALATEIRGSF